MADVIQIARELGKALQKDERFVRLISLSQANDEDQALQDMIGQFNLKRIDLNNEINKTEKDQDKIKALNDEIKALYGQLMSNENMNAYQQAKTELDETVDFILQIIRGSINGEDPDSIEQKSGGCSGSCSSCSGCH